jgi:ADP-ribose pyrophosphatase YjhB (NUDIX family)
MDDQTLRLWVHALISQDDHLLLIPSDQPDTYLLPGGVAVSGEPIEHGLHRTVREQLGTAIAHLDFYAAVEHATDDDGHRSDVVFLFDATLTDPDHLTRTESRPHRWVDERDLAAVTLHPETVRNRLVQAPMSPGRQWWAWTP